MTTELLPGHVQTLPPLPGAAVRLVALLRQPACDGEVVELVESDGDLNARLLRACNSSCYGFEEQVASAGQVLFLLGRERLLQNAIAIAFSGVMAAPLPGYAMAAGELWRHSLITATAAETVARQVGGLDAPPAEAYTAGLLHDIGKLVLGPTLTPDVQAGIRGRIEQGHHLRSDAEKEFLGADHAELGASLLRTWHLPAEIVEAAANHHHPVLEPRPCLSVVTHLANCIAHLAGSAPGWDAYAVRADRRVIGALTLTRDRLEHLVITVRESFARINLFAELA